jgi:Hemolysins and related proteins containing CBS domains
MKAILAALSIALALAPTISAYSVGKNRVFVGTPIHHNRRLVQDCMTPLSRLCTLTESATVDEAVYLLLKLEVSGAPVINENTGELLGIVSTFDFLQQEAGDGALLPIEGTMENVKDYLNRAKKVSIIAYGEFIHTTILLFFYLLC